jgi:molybdopterin synthase sulfur carrier subunit
MSIKVRFFARFRELLGTDLIIDYPAGATLAPFIRDIAKKNKDGYDALFDEHGTFCEFVIVMRNGKRIEHGDTATLLLADGDEIAIFPPVAGG